MSKEIIHTPLRIADLMLPKRNIDLYKWSIIACDQFTSDKKYWEEVETIVGNAPSTLSLILPEIFLEEETYTERLKNIRKHATSYLQNDIFEVYPNGLLLVDRSSPRAPNRSGLVMQVDLSQYDPDPNIKNPIKSTEAIVASRLPKRIEVRTHSNLDLSHILMVYEDKNSSLISQISQHITVTAYSTPLMMNGGTVHAHFCDIDKCSEILSIFFAEKTHSNDDNIILAVGDGNHSLMSAKQVWLDSGADMNSPERWALVELVNIYDQGLKIEPIHRVLFDTQTQMYIMLESLGTISNVQPSQYSAKILFEGKTLYWTQSDSSKIAIEIIEELVQSNTKLYNKIDFIHSEEEVYAHCKDNKENLGLIFPDFDRNSIFKIVYDKKLFPRKSFSLGKGEDKKYYIETCLRK